MALFKKSLSAILSGLMLLCLLTLLPSCVSLPVPPSEYTQDCKITYLTKDQPTNGDLLKLAIDREYDTKLCNVDKKALRAWYEGYRQACGWYCRNKEQP